MPVCTEIHKNKHNGKVVFFDHHYVGGLCIHNLSLTTQMFMLATYINYDGGTSYKDSKIDKYAQAIRRRREANKEN